MKFKDFKTSLRQKEPPAEFSLQLKAMWHESNGNWEKAHEIVQSDDSKLSALVHAYLHLKEGDISNSDYWYAVSGYKKSSDDVEEEKEFVINYLG